MMECYGPPDEERASIGRVYDLDGLNWLLGRRIAQRLPSPIRVELDPDRGLMMPMFDEGILLFSDDLLAALRECGVDNLDEYEVELTNPLTKERHTNYKAINIIGLVSAADLAKSDFKAHGRPLIDVDFDSLTIDPAKTGDLLLFRLAECVSGIVVHEKVREHVDRRGIRHIDWVEPSSWIG